MDVLCVKESKNPRAAFVPAKQNHFLSGTSMRRGLFLSLKICFKFSNRYLLIFFNIGKYTAKLYT